MNDLANVFGRQEEAGEPERTHVDTGRTCKPHTEGPWSEILEFLVIQFCLFWRLCNNPKVLDLTQTQPSKVWTRTPYRRSRPHRLFKARYEKKTAQRTTPSFRLYSNEQWCIITRWPLWVTGSSASPQLIRVTESVSCDRGDGASGRILHANAGQLIRHRRGGARMGAAPWKRNVPEPIPFSFIDYTLLVYWGVRACVCLMIINLVTLSVFLCAADEIFMSHFQWERRKLLDLAVIQRYRKQLCFNMEKQKSNKVRPPASISNCRSI